jgi:hypothetical protein
MLILFFCYEQLMTTVDELAKEEEKEEEEKEKLASLSIRRQTSQE